MFRAQTGLRAIRALLLALPVAFVLALLLSGADPTLAAWRDALARTFLQASILARMAWFGILTALTLGATGLALQRRSEGLDHRFSDTPGIRFSQIDQLAVLSSAAAVFALYLALQMSYLFGNSGGVPGSHFTYAQTVHRGFIELNAATTLSTLVIVTLLSRSAIRPIPRLSRAVALALIVESQVLAVSAWHRVELYESAYGYTQQRLLVSAYAGAVLVVLAMLGWEIIGATDFLRLARRVWVFGIVILCTLVLWNDEAWIVRANLSRYRLTGQLDTKYLTYGLGPDGLPELARGLSSLDVPMRAKLEKCLRFVGITRYDPSSQYQWFEWTLRRAHLREALVPYRGRPSANEPIGRLPCGTS